MKTVLALGAAYGLGLAAYGPGARPSNEDEDCVEFVRGNRRYSEPLGPPEPPKPESRQQRRRRERMAAKAAASAKKKQPRKKEWFER